LETEHDNLRAALAFGPASEEVEAAQRIAASLTWFWAIRRHVAEGMGWYEQVLAADGTPTKARAWALAQAGFMRPMMHLEDLEGCLALLREAQGQFVDLGDDQGSLTARMHIAQNRWWQRDLETAIDRYDGIQAAHQARGFDWGVAFTHFGLGSAAWLMGDVPRAYEHFTKSTEIFGRVEDFALTAWPLLPLANIAVVSKEPDRAAALYEQSLAMMGDLGDRHGLGAVLLGIGLAAHLRGEEQEAEETLVKAQTHLREGGGGQGLSWPLSNVLVDTHTHELFMDATRRYYAGLNLPADEWVRMVYADGVCGWRGVVRLRHARALGPHSGGRCWRAVGTAAARSPRRSTRSGTVAMVNCVGASLPEATSSHDTGVETVAPGWGRTL
jgi:tetratricopeptide (TPR) repeat protein